jgi:hypothetical protein
MNSFAIVPAAAGYKALVWFEDTNEDGEREIYLFDPSPVVAWRIQGETVEPVTIDENTNLSATKEPFAIVAPDGSIATSAGEACENIAELKALLNYQRKLFAE